VNIVFLIVVDIGLARNDAGYDSELVARVLQVSKWISFHQSLDIVYLCWYQIPEVTLVTDVLLDLSNYIWNKCFEERYWWGMMLPASKCITNLGPLHITITLTSNACFQYVCNCLGNLGSICSLTWMVLSIMVEG
jgi:hypothetical protein